MAATLREQGQPRQNVPQTSCYAFVWPWSSEVDRPDGRLPASQAFSAKTNANALFTKLQIVCIIIPNEPVLLNAGEQSPPERAVGRCVLPPILPEVVAGRTHQSTAP